MTWRASTVSLVVVCVSPISGFCYCTVYYMLTRFEVTFLGILVESEHGDEEKQWGTHMEEWSWSIHEEAREKSCSWWGDRASATWSKPGELFHDPFLVYHPLIHAEIKCYLGCLSHALNVAPLNFIWHMVLDVNMWSECWMPCNLVIYTMLALLKLVKAISFECSNP